MVSYVRRSVRVEFHLHLSYLSIPFSLSLVVVQQAAEVFLQNYFSKDKRSSEFFVYRMSFATHFGSLWILKHVFAVKHRIEPIYFKGSSGVQSYPSGSDGIVWTELVDSGLYFALCMPSNDAVRRWFSVLSAPASFMMIRAEDAVPSVHPYTSSVNSAVLIAILEFRQKVVIPDMTSACGTVVDLTPESAASCPTSSSSLAPESGARLRRPDVQPDLWPVYYSLRLAHNAQHLRCMA